MRERLTYDRKCYTIADYYISYKEYIEPNTQYDVDLKTFKAIVTDYFKFIRDEIMLNCKEFKLPCRLGKLSIIKHMPKEFTGKSLRWDWKATRETGKPVYLLNEHSNYFKYRFYWQKKDCLLINKGAYQFVACRQNKRDLAQLIFKKLKRLSRIMIVNRMISSKSVIAKVIADLDLKEDQIRITDIREWILEAILKIGAIQQYDHKVVILPIINHQAALPCDLYKLGQVAFSFQNDGGWLPMRKTTSSFGIFHDRGCGKPCMLIHDTELFPLVKNMFNLTSDTEALQKLNEDTSLRQTLSILLNQWTVGTVNGKYVNGSIGHRDSTMFSNELQYMTKPGYIMTNIPEGFVKVSYYAIFTDEEAMPMIPDIESYKEAIFWYVTMKLMYPKKLKGQISQGDYYDIRNSYNFYRKQAYVEAMMPGTDEIESIKNTWNKLYTEFDDHDTFFSTTGDEQNIYNQNR